MDYSIGELVISPDRIAFHGVGKINALVPDEGKVVVCFFISPLEPAVDPIEVSVHDIESAQLFDECVVYCKNPNTNYWQRARYGGERPDDEHLVIFRNGEQSVVGIEDIYVLNIPYGQSINPIDFLKARCTDTPHFSEWRFPFIRSYIEQRAHCRSISSIPSSSVQFEHHQLAVVRRVLQDSKKRYLLADEVGLGKTIEAGLIMREQLLVDGLNKTAVVGVPATLVDQWKQELTERFHLGELFESNLFVVEHDFLHQALSEHAPEIVVIDEVHQISQWAWSSRQELKQAYLGVSETSHNAETCLLLSGTPLIGNEINFLAMLHLLSPEEYSIDQKGKERFMLRIEERERLGGIYQAFVPENDNGSLEDFLDQLVSLFSTDKRLVELAVLLRPHIDLFSDSSGSDRDDLILALRRYIGENYRLHQRMLRNRREDPSVAYLFPGLAGASVHTYHPHNEPYCLEQYLEEFRGEQSSGKWNSIAVTRENYSEWVELAFVSPHNLKRRAEHAREIFSARLSNSEDNLLRDIIELAPIEQNAKDIVLIQSIKELQESDSRKRFVIFCGECEVADHVYDICRQEFGPSVERHTSGRDIQFISDESIQILICDRSGEDGLNLNGGKKVAVHYSLPVSLPRIEQRLGRLNRYSSSIFAAPVESLVVIPEYGAYSRNWFTVLNDAIQIFLRSVASLQYVLEDEVKACWSTLSTDGYKAIDNLRENLVGEQGIIIREGQRVRAQEELNKLDADIQIASGFADELEEGDEKAEEYIDSMMDWITRGLQFKKKRGEYLNTFRFQYQKGTLMDIHSLLRYCYPALEKVQPDPYAPVTVLMSASRDTIAQGRQVQPMRFGSPFVDLIFRFLSDDPRGIATAWLRQVSNLEQPKVFLGLTALVSKANRNASNTEVRKFDEEFRPQVVDCWVDQGGELVTVPQLINLLESPYQKNRSQASSYLDVNIRSEVWAKLEEYFPDRHWPQTVEQMTKNGVSLVLERACVTEGGSVDNLNIEWLGVRCVILVGGLE